MSGRSIEAPPAGAPVEVAIVIPAYDEAGTIDDVVRRCRATVAAPVIVVDDGSRDATAALAAAAGAMVLRNPGNAGKGASLMRGFAEALSAGAGLVVSIDGDGQHRPEDVPALLAAARAWPGRIVIGSRRAGLARAPRGRRIANRVADFWVSWAAGGPVEDSQSGFRVYPGYLLARLSRLGAPGFAPGFAFESELLIAAGRVGVPTVAVPIPAIYGTAPRASHFRPVADIVRIVLLVGGRLLCRGMYPIGLWRAITVRPACAPPDSDGPGPPESL